MLAFKSRCTQSYGQRESDSRDERDLTRTDAADCKFHIINQRDMWEDLRRHR